jgi:flavin reductase
MGSAVSSTRATEPARAVPEPTVDVSAFREAMSSFPTGVTVVTVASDDGHVHGVTVNSFLSVSLDPMLVLVCLKETSRGLDLIEHAGAFVVNVLSAGQHDVSRWFANRHRPVGLAMFDGLPFESGVTGCPVLVDATASFDCRLRQSHRAGDHLIVLGEVIALVHRPQLAPLIFHAGTYKSLEREPLLQVAQDAESPTQNRSTAAAGGETAVTSWRSVRAWPVADAARLAG